MFLKPIKLRDIAMAHFTRLEAIIEDRESPARHASDQFLAELHDDLNNGIHLTLYNAVEPSSTDELFSVIEDDLPTYRARHSITDAGLAHSGPPIPARRSPRTTCSSTPTACCISWTTAAALPTT